MILFNFKSWSKTNILLGISVVFNVGLVVLWLFTTSLYGTEIRQREKLEYVYDQTLIMEKCLRGLEVYEMPTSTGSAKYVEMTGVSGCYNTWNSIF
jgi:hypothetical protein